MTADKLAAGAVGADALKHAAVTKGAIAGGAVGSDELAHRAVRGQHVALDALTGAQIREPALAQVPSAARAGTARNAHSLGGAGAGAYVAHVKTVRVSSALTTDPIKGPLTAYCPAGTRLVMRPDATPDHRGVGVKAGSSASGERGACAVARVVSGLACGDDPIRRPSGRCSSICSWFVVTVIGASGVSAAML